MRKVLTVTWVVILFATFLGGIVTAQTVNELQAIVKENIEAANTVLTGELRPGCSVVQVEPGFSAREL